MQVALYAPEAGDSEGVGMTTSTQQVMVVEDDPKTAEQLPDLIVLDLMLPHISGLDICRAVRREAEHIPIIMLTAKSTEDDILLGLDLGADDYITKPFSPRQLMARVRAVLRRTNLAQEAPRPPLRFGSLVIDPVRHEVHLGDQLLALTPKEFKLLETMGREPGRAFTRLELVERVFGLDYDGLERTVDAHIMNLRKKLEPTTTQFQYIQTVYGIGYRFAGGADRA
jgi:DNA-binding response OmpR family regulator